MSNKCVVCGQDNSDERMICWNCKTKMFEEE